MLLFTGGTVVSQLPKPVVPAATPDLKAAQNAKDLAEATQQIKQAILSLQAIKTANEQLIEKQQKALTQLDAIQKESDQVRIQGRRN